MKAVSKILTGAAAVAAISIGAAAPAAAQYYPGGGYGGYGGGGLGDVITGAVLNSILRGQNPYGYNQYYGVNTYDLERAAVQQCAAATEQRLNGRYSGRPVYGSQYGNYNPYAYNQGTVYRVAQIDRVNRTRNGNMRVYGLATNAAYQGNYGQPYYGGYNQPYGGGYNNVRGNFRFDCKFERNGRITDLKVNRI